MHKQTFSQITHTHNDTHKHSQAKYVNYIDLYAWCCILSWGGGEEFIKNSGKMSAGKKQKILKLVLRLIFLTKLHALGPTQTLKNYPENFYFDCKKAIFVVKLYPPQRKKNFIKHVLVSYYVHLTGIHLARARLV